MVKKKKQLKLLPHLLLRPPLSKPLPRLSRLRPLPLKPPRLKMPPRKPRLALLTPPKRLPPLLMQPRLLHPSPQNLPSSNFPCVPRKREAITATVPQALWLFCLGYAARLSGGEKATPRLRVTLCQARSVLGRATRRCEVGPKHLANPWRPLPRRCRSAWPQR